VGRRQRLVVDSSAFPTSAGYNPTLTIIALAARTACSSAAPWPDLTH
jgi:choline dehydrogenase-like flavoprotein